MTTNDVGDNHNDDTDAAVAADHDAVSLMQMLQKI